VLRWPITSRSTLKDGLYEYDAIGRLHHKQFGADVDDIAPFLKLKSLGTALLPTNTPRALLIDEIDKSDIDLPNDLLNVFEEGEFSIPELERLSSGGRPIDIRSADPGNETFPIFNGHIKCRAFPFVVMTSNGEREFPAPFLRRCVRLQMPEPDKALLTKVVEAHLGPDVAARAEAMIEEFASDSIGTARATDQLLNAVFLLTDPARRVDDSERTRLRAVLQADLLA
jgi:MoxR-like ATPase